MHKSLCQLTIILLVTSISTTEEAKKMEPPIDQDLPLVLIKTDQGLELPFTVRAKGKGLFKNKKKIQFGIYDFSHQEFYCPAEDNEQRNEIEKAIKQDLMREKIDESCLMKKIKSKTNTPAPQCQKEPHPKIMQVFVEKRVSPTENNAALSKSAEMPCGPYGAGKMLGFGYQVCIEHEPKGWGKIFKKPKVHPIKGTKEVVFYNMCYIAATNEILFTTNTTNGSPLFYNNLLKKDAHKIWPIETYNSIHIPSIEFEQVKLKFEQVTRSSNFKIQLLVDPNDYVMGLWRKPAYHYANVGLIHEDLQQCWNKIHEKVERYIWKRPRYFLDWDYADLSTGAFMLPETGIPKIISDVQIPKIWVKMVYSSYAVALIANNYRDEAVDNIITGLLNCKVNFCKKFIEKNFPNVLEDIRCCRLTDEIQALFGTTLKPIGILEIDGVIEIENKSNANNFSVPYGTSNTGMSPGMAASWGITGFVVGDTIGDVFF